MASNIRNIARNSSHSIHYRHLSVTHYRLRKTEPSLPNLATPDEATQKTHIKRKLYKRMFVFVETYGEKVLSKLLPDVALKALKMFSKGTRALFADMKTFNWANHVLSESGNWQKACNSLSRSQLEVYLYLPGELLRVSPVLILSAFPMAQNVVFPIAMMFPNYLLSTHFYSEEQLMDAFYEEASHRQSYYSSVLRDLILFTPTTEEGRRTFTAISNEKEIPSHEAVMKLVPLFSKDGPFHIEKLSSPHVKHLMKINRVRGSILWFPRFRLQQYANLIRQIDLAIMREGGPEELAPRDLKRSCNLRGLNVSGQSDQVLVEYLQNWIRVTADLSIYDMSLLLHLPVILGFNHPSRI